MSDEPKKRNENGTFAEGNSGGGRPKGLKELRIRARDVVDRHVIAAWESEIINRGDNWVKCSELVTAYGYGKPPSAPEDHDAAKEVFQPLAQLTREQILAIARGEKPE